MSEIPTECKYLSSHEWIRLEDDGTATIGITDHAQDALGDLVYVELPDVGQQLDAGAEAGVVESVKAASDIYAPMSGEVVAINEVLEDAPEAVNDSPYDDGWLFKISVSNETEYDGLMSNEDYLSQIEAE